MATAGGVYAVTDGRWGRSAAPDKVHDLWTVDGIVVQALYRKVAAYRLSDGAEVWSVPLPSAVCETPADPTLDGKVVIVRQERPDDERGNRCNQLQMIDPRTGKVLWRHRTAPGRQFGSLISVDPVVFTTVNAEDTTADWRVVALGPGGKLRTTIDPRDKGLKHCAGSGSGAAPVYESASPDGPGRTFLMGPGGAGTEKVLLRHPAAASAPETWMGGGPMWTAGSSSCPRA
ncbi:MULTISPECIES: outer membrane protein assembly factor BamB family protein [unclassified Streptomyces]|uniref:outer membrane protein assembly factor BamB family protein n=1 Tax=unclassified Streptomyces TaxID=2593676 RepID=UPI00210DC45A|nr:PQQ-binding-like beta-propeller repeat protein [Streptomyces sp. ScaeMP-e83]